MTNEEYARIREEMSRIFVTNLHQGPETASDCSITWLYNKIMDEAADVAKKWSVSIMQPEMLSREMAETVANSVGESISEALLRKRIPNGKPDDNNRRTDSGVPAVHGSDHLDSAASEQVNDGRPEGWTEARCLEYIGTEDADDAELLANLFTHGDWREIQQDFPLFVKWMNERSN